MRTTKRKATRKPKSSKRLKSRRSWKRFITPAEARRLAARHVFNRMFKGATVRDGATVRLGVFLPNGLSANDVWAVFKNQEGFPGFKSSEVILICKRTGRVLYEGSAGDEG